MAGNRRIRTIMPTTSLTRISPEDFDFPGPRKRRCVSRVTTSDGTDFGATLEEFQKAEDIVLRAPSTYPTTKAPPPAPIPRPEPDDVNSKLRLEMERRQFQPLSDDWFWRMLEEMYRVDEKKWTMWAVDLDWMKVLRADFRYLMKILEVTTRSVSRQTYNMGHVTPTIVDLYIYLVCEYRNKGISRKLKGGDLADATPSKQKLSCIVIDTQRIYWEQKKGLWANDENDDKAPRKFIFQDFPTAWALVQEALAQYDDETFMNLDYIFFPYEYQAFHTVLLGIAVKQRFCFHIDNSGTLRPRPSKTEGFHGYPNIYAMHLIEAVIFEKFGETLDTARFPLFGEWQYRTEHPVAHQRTTDFSPNAPRQMDTCNCGMMTLTMATNLAFGYDMMCGRGKDIANNPPRVGKRMRVAAELLNGGFNKPFDYPMFNIPTELREIIIDESYIHNLRPSPKPADEKAEDEDEDEEPEGLDEPQDEEDDENYQPGNLSRAEARTKVKKAKKAKKMKWSGQKATDPDPLDPDSSGPAPTADEEPIRTLWPAQMDPAQTGKCGCIYPIKNPRFSHPRYRSREELKRAAHLNGMTNWEMWEKMPLHLFRAWMENTMAGRGDEECTPWIDALQFAPLENPDSTTNQPVPTTSY
ncbi:hypothetical protein DSL72_005031 [Monilinia vaccinii-corymbosi]|uniref:Ubiquitin-like protease family profile domain-containing protein n=1 Tax=Monilinia vaccinii-corymbosi TaxID=61207 RepID=A0A8A3PEH2_9HELO|nr:hypothetical protein DSL72_005031 [Monilinia vaccinii-corymbosi]